MIIKVDYSISPIYINTNVSPIYIKVDYGTGGGGGGAVWGDITGTLSNQVDLQAALDAKFDDPTGTTLQYIDGTGGLQTFPLTLPVLQQVRNQTGSSVVGGTVVYINGATGNLPTIAKAIATGDPTSAQTLGMVQGTIANNGVGYVIVIGTCSNLDTSAYSEGQQLYLSGTTAGGVTTTKPYAPTHLVYVGIVTRSHPTLGTIEVRVQNGYEMDELHDVSAQNPNNNDGLFYNTSTSLWEKKSIANVLGYTPGTVSSVALSVPTGLVITSGSPITTSGTIAVGLQSGYSIPTTIKQGNWDDAYTFVSGFPSQTGNSGKYLTTDGSSLSWGTINLSGYVPTSRTLTINGTAYDLSADRSWSVGTVTSVSALTIGTSGTDITSTVATGTTTPIITLNIPTASATNRGALSSTDWSTFNNKQGAITLTTTGTSGAATLIGNTLNIPQYSGTNIYNSDGTLTGNRTVTMGSYQLYLSGYNTTNSQFRLGGLEIQSYSLNNSWIGENVYYNGTTFVARQTGTTGMFYFYQNEGQFRLTSSVSAGTSVGINNNTQLKINSNGTFAVGSNITTSINDYANAKFIVFGSTGNVNIGSAVDSGFKFEANGYSRILHDDGNYTFGFTIRNNNTTSSALTGLNLNNNGTSVGQIVYCASNYVDSGLQNTVLFSSVGNQKIAFVANAGNISTGGSDIYFKTRANFSNGITIFGNSQNVTINGSTEYASAKFAIDSTTSGFLLPRMTGTQVEAISTPATGLMAYATAAGSGAVTSTGWWGYDGSAWTKINGGGSNIYTADGTLTGNRTLTHSTYSLTFAGTTSSRLFANGNWTIGGTTDADYKLDVQGTGRFTDILSVTTGSTKGINYNGCKLVEPIVASNYSQLQVTPSSGNKDAVFLITPSGTNTTSVLELYDNSAATSFQRISFKNNNGTLEIGGDSSAKPLSLTQNNIRQFYMFTSGNVMLQNGGTFTDIGSSRFTINSTTSGFLPPRMTETQKNAISTPATGLLIYQTDGTEGLYQYKSTGWNQVAGTGGGGGITRSVNSISTPTTAGAASTTDYVYLISGTTTLTLPTAVGNTNRYTLKNVGTNTVTINTTSSQTIDGSTSITMAVRYTALDVISDGTNWNII